MRKCIAAGILVLLLTFVACHDDRSAPITGIDRPVWPGKPLLNVETSCYLTPAQCAKLDSAITILENDSDPDCVYLGNNARNRFNETDPDSIGFHQGDEQYPEGGYTNMIPDPNAQWGWKPVDGKVYVNPGVLAGAGKWNPGDLAAWLVSHEEFHHEGWPPTHSDQPGPPPPPCELIEGGD